MHSPAEWRVQTLYMNYKGFKPILTFNFHLDQWIVSFAPLNYITWTGFKNYSNMHLPAGWKVPLAPLSLNGIQTHTKMYSPAGWRVSRAPLSLNGIQTHSKMYSPGGWRVSRTPLSLNGIQTYSKMYSPAGWRVSHAPLSACLLSRPEVKVGQWTRCFRTLCWKPRHAGSTSTMRPSFGNMSPEGRNNVVQEFWRGQYSSQMIWLNWPRGLWLFSSRGRYIYSHVL